VALSRLTKGVAGGFFTRNTRIAFGHGCDRSSYVIQLNAAASFGGQFSNESDHK
jgi:hypothetical protein